MIQIQDSVCERAGGNTLIQGGGKGQGKAPSVFMKNPERTILPLWGHYRHCMTERGSCGQKKWGGTIPWKGYS